MPTRQPFEYPDWCTGPEVDLDFGAGFPVCDYVTFTTPVYEHVPMLNPPDLDPPPFCPCIPTIKPTAAATYKFGGSGKPTFDIRIVPVTDDCCNPDFRISFDLEIPCMPFEMVATAKYTNGPTYAGKPGFSVRKQPGTCKYDFNLVMPPSSGSSAIELCLYEHGQGVNFITCCSGTGYIGLDVSMVKKPHGTLQIQLVHHVNLQIPLLAQLANYSTGICRSKLHNDEPVYDPWGVPVHWKGTTNAAGSDQRKYCNS